LISPVYTKELTQLALGRRLLWTKLSAVVALLGLALLPAANMAHGEQARLGLTMVQVIAMGTLLLIGLLAPPLVAGVLCGERQANTLGLLFLTRLSRWQIVQDKGLSRLTLLGLLALLAVPFLYGGLLFGGVEVAQAICAMGYLGAMVLLCGAACMLASAICPGFGSALMTAYALELFLVLALPAVCCLPSRGEAMLMRLCPLAGLSVVFNSWMLGRYPGAFTYWHWSVGYGLVAYLLAVSVGALLVRHQAVPEESSSGLRWWDPRRWGPGLGRAVLRWLTPIGWIALLPARTGHHPVAWRVGRLTGPRLLVVRVALLGYWLAVVIIVVVVAVALSMGRGVDLVNDFLDEAQLYLVGYMLWTPFLALCLAVVAGSSIASERLGGTWDVLLSTRQRGWRVIGGYWLGLAKAVLAASAVVASWLAIGGCMVDNRSVSVVAPLLAFVVYGLLIVTIGLRCSLAAATPTRGVLWTLGITMAVLFLPLIAGVIVDELVRGADWRDLAQYSPGYWWAQALDNRLVLDSGHGTQTGRTQENWWQYLLHLGSTLTLCAVLVAEMALTFDRRNGRQEEAR